MKTIEEKAKAYDEALERAREMCTMPTDKATMEYIFPELCESEDERMGDIILEGFKNYSRSFSKWNNVPVERIIAYLEKQKEVQLGDKDRYMEGYMNGMNDALKEQKPAWSEEDEKMIRLIISILEDEHPNVFWRSDEMESGVYTEELVDLLKRICPSWKPSRAQMSMLLAVINEPNNASSESCHLALAELYEELKKLCQ